MFRNYLKIAWKKFDEKHKTFSFIKHFWPVCWTQLSYAYCDLSLSLGKG